MTNPITLEETDTFKFKITDQYFNLIDKSEQSVTLKMQNPAVFKSASLKVADLTNGAKTNYDFSIVANTAIFPFDFILVTFPAQIMLPVDQTSLNCSSTTP